MLQSTTMTPGGFNFERFTETGKSFNARATIRSNGQIGFNEGARNLFELAQFSYVVLFFDSNQRAVGLKFTNNKEEVGALPFKADLRNTCVNAAGFLDKHGIDYKKSSRHSLERHGDFIVMMLTDVEGAPEVETPKQKENHDEVLANPVVENQNIGSRNVP